MHDINHRTGVKKTRAKKLKKKNVDQKQASGENLYSSANIIRNRIKYVMDGACKTHREMKNTLLPYLLTHSMEHSPS
jgi:hypothetical protein